MTGTLEPLYFGPEGCRLFGVLDGPPRAALGVVIAQPTGDECPDALRGLRLLAARLARAGLSTLRFDWAGTGDSEGGIEHHRLGRWVEDVGVAIDCLADRRLPERLALVGVRVGGSIAVQALATRRIAAAALWDPVVVGRDFVEAKRAAHRQWCAEEARERPDARRYFGREELLGYPFPDGLRRDLLRLDLGAMRAPPAADVMLLRHDGRPREGGWWETVALSKVGTSRVRIAEAPPWTAPAGFDAAPVPARSLDALSSWLVERAR